MKARIDFEDGTYAILREKVNVGGRKAMERTSVPAARAMRRIRAARLTQEREDNEEPDPNEVIEYSEADVHAMQRFEMAGVFAMLAHWTRDEPQPRSIDDVEQMDPDVYEAIAKEVRPHVWELLGRPNVSPDAATDEKGVALPDSPTGPSLGSKIEDSGARVIDLPHPSETATETSSTGTASTSSEASTPA